MPDFRVTFGQLHAVESRPRGGDLDFVPDPAGWVTIVADSQARAREAAFDSFGRSWAFLYSEPFGPEWQQFHPRGELARIDAVAPQAQEVPQ